MSRPNLGRNHIYQNIYLLLFQFSVKFCQNTFGKTSFFFWTILYSSLYQKLFLFPFAKIYMLLRNAFTVPNNHVSMKT